MADERPAGRPRSRGRLATLGRQWGWMAAVLLVVGFIAAVAVVANGRGAPGTALPDSASVTTVATIPSSVTRPAATVKGATTTRVGAARPSVPFGFFTVALSTLPPETATTWALIQGGGPFPYREDGVAFDNHAKHLPDKPLGWYREYTVPTPGAPDRGVRRLVVGQDTSAFWTADDANSFVFVDVGR
jgi:ribonuclease T1